MGSSVVQMEGRRGSTIRKWTPTYWVGDGMMVINAATISQQFSHSRTLKSYLLLVLRTNCKNIALEIENGNLFLIFPPLHWPLVCERSCKEKWPKQRSIELKPLLRVKSEMHLLVSQLDDLCYLYLDFCFDHLVGACDPI